MERGFEYLGEGGVSTGRRRWRRGFEYLGEGFERGV
jgi:hypothetical protein